MPEQPFYKLCEFCAHYIQTVSSKDKKICTRFPHHEERLPDDTCGEWICARCWIPWDMVTQGEDEPMKVYIVDHTKCPKINFEAKPFIELLEEDL